MNNLDTAQLAAIVAAVGIGLGLLGRTRIPLVAGFVLVGAAELGLLHGSLPHVSPRTSAAGIVAGAVGVAGAWALGHRPELITPLVLATAPLRLPLNFSTHNRFLVSVAGSGQLGRLLPLYGVLGIGVLELSWRVLRGGRVAPIPRYVAIPVTAFAALSCISLTWSSSESAGANLLAYFLLPFCVLVAVVARAPFPSWMPRVLAIEAVALASLFAVVGLVEDAPHRLLCYSHSLQL